MPFRSLPQSSLLCVMIALSLLTVLFAVDAFPHGGNSSEEVVQAMIVELLNAGGGEPNGFEQGNETTVDFTNATDVVAGNLTEDRSMGGGMLRSADVNGFDNHWWELAPEHTRIAFKECCVYKETMDQACTDVMCDWESTRYMEIGKPVTFKAALVSGVDGADTGSWIGVAKTKGLDGKRCIENLQQLADYLFCFAGGLDNTECCTAAGVTTQACLDLCAGTLPAEGMNSRAFRACSEAGNGEERKVGLCSVFAYVTPVTRTPPIFPTLACLRTVTFDLNGTMVASCL